MGVSATLLQSSFTIKYENKREALKAVKALAKTQDIDWVNYEDWNTLEEAMNGYRFDVDTNEEGDIVDIRFIGEKAGDEEKLFNALKPFVEDGSKLVFGYGVRQDKKLFEFGESNSPTLYRTTLKTGKVHELTKEELIKYLECNVVLEATIKV